MKNNFYLSIFICFIMMSFNLTEHYPSIENSSYDPFAKKWKEIEALENNGKTKSANEKVKLLFKLAKQKRNDPQIVKALLYQSKYAMILEENSEHKIVKNIKAEMESANILVKSFLQSILADLYWQYFNRNSHKLTATFLSGELHDDFRNWSSQQLLIEAQKLFDNSISQREKLSKNKIEEFKEIVEIENEQNDYIPLNIYDFLVLRALNFYSDSKSSLPKPKYEFLFNQKNAFESVEIFTADKIMAKDSTNEIYKSYKLFQEILINNPIEKNKEKWLWINRKRLNWALENSLLKDKEKRYEKALENLVRKLSNSSIQAEVYFDLARFYYEKAYKYSTDKENFYLKAEAICKEVQKIYPNSKGAKNCQILLKKILTKSIEITCESFLPINKSNPIYIEYRNAPRVYLKLIKISKKEYINYNNYYLDSQEVKSLLKKPVFKQWNYSLPSYQDRKRHSLIAELPPLENGFYAIYSSFSKEAKGESNSNSGSNIKIIQITDIAYQYKSQNNGTHLLRVLNRVKGTPITNAKVSITKLKTEEKIIEISDSEGRIKAFKGDNERKYQVEIKVKNDMALFSVWMSSSNFVYKRKTESNIHFFTDRKIYRPGQTVWFKGIVVNHDKDNKYKVENEFIDTIELLDVNYQKVSSLDVKSNSFGSFSGSFIIPNSGINGRMIIKGKHGNTYIQVEEYKRPSFEIKFLETKEFPTLNSKVLIRGNVKSFSGVGLSNATVSYRVVRKTKYPYKDYFWCLPPPNHLPSKEIEQGISSTDNNGNFEFKFFAEPDSDSQVNSFPIFSFHVEVTAIDINGETQSNEKIFKIGHQPYTIHFSGSSNWDLNEKIELSIKGITPQEKNVSLKGKLHLYPLEKPKRVLRSKFWDNTDQFLFTKSEFIEKFPNDIYNNDFELYNREKYQSIWSSEFDTHKRNKLEIPKLKLLKPGNYLLVAKTRENGKEIIGKHYFLVKDVMSKKLEEPTFLKVDIDKETYQPNDTLVIYVSTSIKNSLFTYDIVTSDKVVFEKTIGFDDSSRMKIEFPIKEIHRGKLEFRYTFMAMNRIVTEKKKFDIPFTNKELKIKTQVFRNKVIPGSKEEWKLKILDYQNKPILAEVLVNMYDASLDGFLDNNWKFPLYYHSRYNNIVFWEDVGFQHSNFQLHEYDIYQSQENYEFYIDPYLKWFDFDFVDYYSNMRYYDIRKRIDPDLTLIENNADGFVATNGFLKASNRSNLQERKKKAKIKIRKNFSETAFFYPHLVANNSGEIEFTFKVPEALTKWNFMVLAHTKDLKKGYFENTIVSQKKLMVTPNLPRFIRNSDKLVISSKISNLSDMDINGIAEIEFLDAFTKKPITKKFTIKPTKKFKISSKESIVRKWNIQVPENQREPVILRLYARSSKFSDGEEHLISVLPNKKLVTKSIHLWMTKKGEKKFKLSGILPNDSDTHMPQTLTLEFTGNPVWLAVKSLPYIMESPHENTENVFSRIFANSIAHTLAMSQPKFKAMFDQWKLQGSLDSELEKNQELKQILIQETPWVRDALSEKEKEHRLGQLFDINQMARNLDRSIKTLQQQQLPSGGWPWFNSGIENNLITLHIVSGLSYLEKLKSLPKKNSVEINLMKLKAWNYLNKIIKKSYQEINKYKHNKETYIPQRSHLLYLYALSFENNFSIQLEQIKAAKWFYTQAKKKWLKLSIRHKALLSLIALRNGDRRFAEKIGNSIIENSILDQEMGRYWKQNINRWIWNDSPIETQVYLIEAFQEIGIEKQKLDEMKVWLLKNKQTNSWESTKATVLACYAILKTGDFWMEKSNLSEILIGGKKVIWKENERGTEYVKANWREKEIKKEFEDVLIRKRGTVPVWGGLYYQYFEDLDKIEKHNSGLQIEKEIYKEKIDSRGKVLYPISENHLLKVGDKIIVRLIIKTNRDMEFVHLKDMRSSGFEPTNVLSKHYWKGGGSYYMSIKDASTNFFFDFLKKGSIIIEHELIASIAGDFSLGNATIQSMYAPAFAAHTKGIRVIVSDK